MEKHGVLKRKSLQHNPNHIKWDEQTIKEQDKHRGTYQKITQPKTPRAQRVSVHSDNKIIHVQSQEDAAIEKHLEQAQLNASRNQSKKPDLAKLNEQLKAHEPQKIPEEPMTEQQRKKHEQFLRKRAQHYSQFKKIQQAKKHLHDQQQ